MQRSVKIMLHFKNILVPYDGSEQAKRAVNTAVSFARSCDCPKIYIATISNSATPLEISAIANSDMQKREKEDFPGQIDLTEAEALIPDSMAHDLLFEIGEPVPMLLYLAGETKADLIIMGNRGRSTWKSLLMGSVSRDVLSNAKCPVIIVK